jgi:hypothetical protein
VRGILKKIKQSVLVGDRVRVAGIDWEDLRGESCLVQLCSLCKCTLYLGVPRLSSESFIVDLLFMYRCHEEPSI